MEGGEDEATAAAVKTIVIDNNSVQTTRGRVGSTHPDNLDIHGDEASMDPETTSGNLDIHGDTESLGETGGETIVSDEEDDLVWNENRCVVCNVTMNVDDPANRTEVNTKLKKFFFEYLAVSERLKMLPDDSTFPFCPECTEDLDKLMALACKIEFMDLQFEKLRDTMARKTIKTFLHRTRPETTSRQEDSPEPLYDDVKDEPIETANLPKRMYNLNDLLFKQWKRQYDTIIPGRYKKYPTLMKAVDPKHRVSYYRIDSSGRHQFVSAVEGTDGIPVMPSESPARTQVILQGVQGLQQGVLRGLKRKPVFKINGDTLKRVKMCPDENSLEGSFNGEEMDGQQRLGELIESANVDKMYKCPLCPKTFTSKAVLNYHSRTHSGELPFPCDVCGKGFAVPHYLMIHMRSHTGERPFKCTVCEKTFAQRGGLATHALVHSGEKPYVCTTCNKAFRQKYHLTQHQLIHSGVKPFQCEICERRFNVKMNLREHMRRHTGERPYRCSFCNCQGFFRKKMLRDHISKAHPERQMPPELTQLGPTAKFPKPKNPGEEGTGSTNYTTANKSSIHHQGGMISGVNIKSENQVHDNDDEDEEDDDSYNMTSSATLISIDVVDDKMPQLHNILDDGGTITTTTTTSRSTTGENPPTLDLMSSSQQFRRGTGGSGGKRGSNNIVLIPDGHGNFKRHQIQEEEQQSIRLHLVEDEMDMHSEGPPEPFLADDSKVSETIEIESDSHGQPISGSS